MKRLSEKQKYLHWAIFAGVLFVLFFFLNRYTVYTLDSDASSELVLAKHLADAGGGIMSKNWYYSTEVEFLNDQLAFELMFFFTNNWHVVRMGGTMILVALLLISFYYFCRETDSKQHFPLLAALILLPLSKAYFNIVFKNCFTFLFANRVVVCGNCSSSDIYVGTQFRISDITQMSGICVMSDFCFFHFNEISDFTIILNFNISS